MKRVFFSGVILAAAFAMLVVFGLQVNGVNLSSVTKGQVAEVIPPLGKASSAIVAEVIPPIGYSASTYIG